MIIFINLTNEQWTAVVKNQNGVAYCSPSYKDAIQAGKDAAFWCKMNGITVGDAVAPEFNWSDARYRARVAAKQYSNTGE